MDRELLNKLMNEDTLSAADEARLDAALSASNSVRGLMAQLPEESPSMQWRSELNEKLLALQPAPAKRFVWWKFTAPVAIAAAAMAGTIFLRHPAANLAPIQPNANVESMLIASHLETEAAMDVSSVDPGTPKAEAAKEQEEQSWSPHDLDSF